MGDKSGIWSRLDFWPKIEIKNKRENISSVNIIFIVKNNVDKKGLDNAHPAYKKLKFL
jgi:hypothetical protein